MKLLSGKLELLSSRGGSFLSEFLGVKQTLNIPRHRSREATVEGSLYHQVRQSLKLPAALLNEVYGSRACRHFYTPTEIDAFRKQWQA